MEFPIALDPELPIPIYLQISKALKEHILSGALAKGSKLPSTQSLADTLSVGRSTVVKAYEDLNSQGYSVAVAGGGTFVSNRAFEISGAVAPQLIARDPSLSRYGNELLHIAGSGATSVENEMLNYGAPPVDLLPIKSWKQLLMSECEEFDIQSGDWIPEPFGLYRCRAAVAEFLCRNKGLKCSAEQVMIFAGCKESFAVATKLLVDPGDAVAIENPSYEDPRNLFALSRAEIQAINCDEHGMRVEDLLVQRRPAKFVYVTPSQDPTGVVMPMSRRKALIEWAQENNAYVWEEGWDSDYSYGSAPLPAVQSMDTRGNVIYSYSFWKTLYPLVTLGVLVLPPQLIASFEKARQIGDIQFSMLEQKALAKFIQGGHMEKHLKKTKRIFEERRKVLLDCLLQEFRGAIDIPKQSAALHLCVRFANSFERKNLIAAAQACKLPFYPSSGYYMKGEHQNEFLMPFTLLASETLIQRVKDFVSTLQSTSRA